MNENDIINKIETQLDQKRIMVAIAGPPTAGKSTISEKLIEHFGDEAVVLPMDGFHLDNVILDDKNLRTRKGSPESFDAHGFISTIKRVANSETVYAPIFDRGADLARAGAIEIKDQKIVLVEGNYLFLNQEPWQELLPFWDVAIWLDISLETVRERSIARWLGFGFDQKTAEEKADLNDVKNAEFLNKNISNIKDLMRVSSS